MDSIINCCTNRDGKKKEGEMDMAPANGLSGATGPPVATVPIKDKILNLHAKAKEHGPKLIEKAKTYNY
jgi:hypothetical protein